MDTSQAVFFIFRDFYSLQGSEEPAPFLSTPVDNPFFELPQEEEEMGEDTSVFVFFCAK